MARRGATKERGAHAARTSPPTLKGTRALIVGEVVEHGRHLSRVEIGDDLGVRRAVALRALAPAGAVVAFAAQEHVPAAPEREAALAPAH